MSVLAPQLCCTGREEKEMEEKWDYGQWSSENDMKAASLPWPPSIEMSFSAVAESSFGYFVHYTFRSLLSCTSMISWCIKDYIVLKIIFVRRKETWPIIKRCVELVQMGHFDLSGQSWIVMTKYYRNPNIFGTTPLHSISSLCTTGIKCLQWWWWWKKVGKLEKSISM